MQINAAENDATSTEQRSESQILMCFPCRLTFDSMTSFQKHVTSEHDVTMNERERLISEGKGAGIVLQKSSTGKSILCFLEKIQAPKQDVTGTDEPPVVMEADVAMSGDQNLHGNKQKTETDVIKLGGSPSPKPDKDHEVGKYHCDVTTSQSDVTPKANDVTQVLDLSNANNLVSCQPQGSMPFSGDVTSSINLPTMLVGAPERDVLRSSVSVISTKGFSPPCNLEERQNANLPTTDTSPPRTSSADEIPASSMKENRYVSAHEDEHESRGLFRAQEMQKSDAMMLNTSTSVDPMFSMSLFQSRNSCKTLKCPKCNWHYKYRQTLEAHMKEKHMEDTTDCAYCNAGQAHPRLSRGESYSCGYKPFKCNVCNYSTTTKGNLSIHMQSDKHLYNARTMQHRQQECLRQAATSTFTPPRVQGNQSETTTSLMDDVQLTSRSPSSESYNSNYRDSSKSTPNRRRRTSSKTNSSTDGNVSASSVPSARREPSTSGKWRCDVCGYETTIARNLRIHNTSEKHAQNVALMERGLMGKIRQNGEDLQTEQNDANRLGAPQGMMDYYTTALKSLQQNHNLNNDVNGRMATDDAEKARKLQADYLQQQLLISQQQQLLLAQQYQQLMVAAAAASTLQQRLSSGDEDRGAAELLVNQAKQLQNAHLWKQLFPNVANNDGDANASLPAGKAMTGNSGVNSKVTSSFMFSCDVCGVFGTDDLASLEAHTRRMRHSDVTNDALNNEWIMRTPRDGYFCRLCKYTTPLKTNFNLHCKTEKHTNKLNLIAHVREGGAATEWMITHVINGNITQSVACNTCQFVTHSLEKLKQHCSSEQHQGVQTVCQFLHNYMKRRCEAINKTGRSSDLNLTLRCLACGDFKTPYIVEMVRHMQTSEHQIQLQRHNNPPMTTLQDVVAIEADEEPENPKEENSVKMETDKECHYCNYVTDDDDRLKMHIMMQHSDQPPTQCPLCQEYFKDNMHLQVHLMQFHKISLPTGADDVTNSESPEKVSSRPGSAQESSKSPKEAGNFSLSIDQSEVKNEPRASSIFKPNETEMNVSSAMDVEESPKNDLKELTTNLDPKQLMTSSPHDVKNQIQQHNDVIAEQRTTSTENENQNEIANRPLSPSTPSDSYSRSCPNLAAIFDHDAKPSDSAKEQDNIGGFPDPSTKPKRTRIRSCPVVESSRSRACLDLLTNYGLEQALHYVENRSPENRNKAKSFKIDQEEKKSPPREPQDVNSNPNEGGAPVAEDRAENVQVKTSMESTERGSPEAGSEGVGKGNDDEVLSCQYCGKEFTGLWILKAHEEVAHGVCIPTKKIQKVASAYSDQFWVKVRDQIGANPDQGSATEQNDLLMAQATPPSGINGVNQEQAKEMQQQMVLKAILGAQSGGNQWESAGIQDATGNQLYMNEALPGNVLSMNLYSALLQMQAQSLGLTPFQLLANAAAAQQIQQQMNIGSGVGGLLRHPDTTGRAGATPLNFAPGLTALPNQGLNQVPSFDNFPKKDLGKTSTSSSSQPPQMEIPVKRPRTRITDDQLKILRANFDINNSPTEEQIEQMASQTGLPPKVIKHWFRNTLFKERQRSKDSPYNFNIPPITSLEDAYKKSSIKEEPMFREKTDTKPQDANQSLTSSLKMEVPSQHRRNLTPPEDTSHEMNNILINDASRITNSGEILRRLAKSPSSEETVSTHPSLLNNALSLVPHQSSFQQRMKKEEISVHQEQENKPQPKLPSYNFPSLSMDTRNDSYYYDNHSTTDASMTSQSGSCRRTPRTRFTDYQLQVLQEFFDRNAYPKDDDLDRMSTALNLSTRVIVVWFQNARQKARKSLEQQQQTQNADGDNLQVNSASPDLSEVRSMTQQQQNDSASPGVEDLARRALNEVSKTISRRIVESDGVKEQRRGKPNPEVNALPCQYCDATFTSSDSWKQHHQQHVMASMFGQYMYMQGLVGENTGDEKPMGNTADGKPTFAEQTYGKIPKQWNQSNMMGSQSGIKEEKTNSSSYKRKMSISPTLSSSSSTSPYQNSQLGSFKSKGPFDNDKEGAGVQKDPKRLRTTITPEQLEFLYKQYLIDSSPSRKVIEQISEVVGLKKRVVQVWFQNTRARERKGQFRSSVARCVTGQMTHYKFCQLCRMVFRSKVELDAHLQIKHGQDDVSSASPPEKKFKSELSMPTITSNDVSKPENFVQIKGETSSNMQNPMDQVNKSFGNITNAASRDNNNNVASTSTNQSQAFYDAIGQQGVDLQKKLASLYSGGAKEFPAPALFNFPPTGGAAVPNSAVKSQSRESTSPKQEVSIERQPVVTQQYDHAVTSAVLPFSRNSMPEMTFASVSKPSSSVSGTSPTSVAPAESGILPPPKRYRTQMSSSQVRALKSCFKACKTPSLPECELIGSEVGLPKRVVQVWFQNSRAKEKKYKLKQPQNDVNGNFVEEFLVKECEICYPAVHFASQQHAREHTFSRSHLQQLVRHLEYEASSGCGVSQHSPASSYDSSDAAFLSEPSYSPPTQVRAPSPLTSFAATGGGDSQLSGHVTLTVSRVGERGNFHAQPGSEEDRRFSSAPSDNSAEENRFQHGEEQNSNSTNSAVSQNRNELLEQYQQAMQQFLANQQQEGATEGTDEDKHRNLQQIQSALQQSVFQMFQLSQSSGAELADK
uniref:Zinc finger homeobox protein 4-like n=1 Tax=Phallusia mammillata TaxID=59560 RepID=A0A6F9DY77_9ASCI|nr:zinc finger homeobox protein 4-like [Phallusia mammillata]